MHNIDPSTLGSAEYSEKLIHPGANVSFFAWLALLGIPAMLLFLIYSKAEVQSVPAHPSAMMETHHAHTR